MAMAITTLAEGRYVDVNEAFERQMGYGRAELIGRTTLELNVWPSPADRAAMIARLQHERTLRDQNTQFRTKSGRLITTLYTVALISIAGQPCVLAAIEDITAQKQAEDALRAQRVEVPFVGGDDSVRHLHLSARWNVLLCQSAGGSLHRIFLPGTPFQDRLGPDPPGFQGSRADARRSAVARRSGAGSISVQARDQRR